MSRSLRKLSALSALLFALLGTLPPAYGNPPTYLPDTRQTLPLTSQASPIPNPPAPVPSRPFNKLAEVELKSICGYLSQKDINSLLGTSHRCMADVRANDRTGLATFKKGRNDTLYLHTSAQLSSFLSQLAHGALHYLYASSLKVILHNEEELELFLKNEKLQSSVTSLNIHLASTFTRQGDVKSLAGSLVGFKKLEALTLTIKDYSELKDLLLNSSLQNTLTRLALNYESPYNGERNKESLAGLLRPFIRLTSLEIPQVWSNEPTRAYSLISENNTEEFQDLILKEPKNLIIFNLRGRTLAHYAATRESLDILKFLAEHAPESIKKLSNWGEAPIHIAATRNSLEAVRFLSEYDLESLKLQNLEGNTPVHLALLFEKPENAKILARLAPEALTMQNKYGQTPVLIASQHGPSEILTLLTKLAPQALLIQDRRGQSMIALVNRHPSYYHEISALLQTLDPSLVNGAEKE